MAKILTSKIFGRTPTENFSTDGGTDGRTENFRTDGNQIGPAGLCRPKHFSFKLALQACVDLKNLVSNWTSALASTSKIRFLAELTVNILSVKTKLHEGIPGLT